MLDRQPKRSNAATPLNSACAGSLDGRFRSKLTTSLVLTAAKPGQLPTSASDPKRTFGVQKTRGDSETGSGTKLNGSFAGNGGNRSHDWRWNLSPYLDHRAGACWPGKKLIQEKCQFGVTRVAAVCPDAPMVMRHNSVLSCTRSSLQTSLAEGSHWIPS